MVLIYLHSNLTVSLDTKITYKDLKFVYHKISLDTKTKI